MSKITSPKAWYLFGVGVVALGADGVRRLIRRRRNATAEVEAEVKPVTTKAKTTAREVEAKVEEVAEPVVKPAKKAASKAKSKAKEVEAKAEEVAEPVVAPAKNGAAEAIARGEEVQAELEKKVAEPAVPAVEFVKARTAKAKPALEEAVAALPDDLTAIKGIGPTYARRLSEAGYTHYADLAQATPEALREITKAPPMADPEAWIEQARGL